MPFVRRLYWTGLIVASTLLWSGLAQAASRDRTPPTGRVVINNGAAFADSTSVALTLTATDNPGGSGMVGGRAGMQIRNNNPRKWPARSWEPFRPTKSWTLASTSGAQTVYVKFRDKAGNAMRNPVTATIRIDSTPPTVPTVMDDGDWTASNTTLHAGWSTSSDPESGVVEYQFKIHEFSIAGSREIIPWTSTGNLTSVTRAGLSLVSGANYVFEVRARNGAGSWSVSGSSDGIRVDATPPSSPLVQDDGAWTASTSILHAKWAASRDDESGIAEYQYAIGTTPGGTQVIGWTSIGLAAEITKAGLVLAQGATYYISVRSRNGASTSAGPWSGVGSSDGIRVDATAPTTPVVTDDGAFTATRNQLSARWTASDPESGIAEYQYAIGTSPDNSNVVSWTSTGTATEVTQNGLSLVQGTRYYVSVRARNGASGLGGPWSDVGGSDGITVDVTLPTTPVVVDDGDTASSLTSLHARWSSSDPESGIIEYACRIEDSFGSEVFPWTSVGNVTEKTWTGLSLENTRTYIILVQAINGAGAVSSIGSSDGIQILQDATPPSPPIVLDDGDYTASNTELHASWFSADPDTDIAEYQYAVGTSPGGTQVRGWTSAGTRTEETIKNLSLVQGQRYFVNVKAANSEWTWSVAGSSDGIIVDTTPPSTPVVTDDGAIAADRTALHARWSASDADSGVAEYVYAIGTNPGGTQVVSWTSATATEITHPNLHLGRSQTYYFSVKAVSGAGLESAAGSSDGIRVNNAAPVMDATGNKIIRVQGGTSAPSGGGRTSSAARSVQEGPQILIVKLKSGRSGAFASAVDAGKRLRTQASPAHIQRLDAPQMDPLSLSQLSLEELCARNNVLKSEPLFPSSVRTSVSRGAAAAGSSSVGIDRVSRIEVPAEYLLRAAIEFSRHPQVEYCEPRMKMDAFLTPNDPYLSSSGSWDQSYSDLWGLKRIDVERAWDLTTGSSDVIVAVVDTGIDPDHPDLFPNLWHNEREIPGNNVDDDGNGFVDDTWGWDFDAGDRDPSDGHGHGTHVAGTVAAVGNNRQGIVGVAWGSRVMALKGLDDFGTGFTDNLAQAIVYAANNGARIINMSWGGQGRSELLEDVIRYAHDEKNVVLVAAAGNSNADACGFTPANIDQVITVAAIDHTDHKASWSNWGLKIDVAAPGGSSVETDGTNRAGANILSCRASGTDLYGDGSTVVGGEYIRARGTSMAAPHVAGVCALIISRQPGIANESVRRILRSTADDILDPLNNGDSHPGQDIWTGAGRINAYAAVNSPPMPVVAITEPKPYAAFSGPSAAIRGVAAGTGFRSYRLSYGSGELPSAWTDIAQSSTPVTNGLLGTWDISSLPFGTYVLRLLVTADGFSGPIEERVVVKTQLPFRQGWPGEYPLQNAESSSRKDLLIEDLDRDGVAEMVVARVSGRRAFIDLLRTDQPLEVKWSREIPAGSLPVSLAAGDLDGDGDLEIVVLFPGEIWVLHHDGSLAEGWPKPGFNENWGSPNLWPVLEDLDGDGAQEVITLEIVDHQTNLIQVDVYRGNGSYLSGWPKRIDRDSQIPGPGGEPHWPRIADLDGDGDKEIVLFEKQLDIYPALPIGYAWHHNGTPVAGWPVANSGQLANVDRFVTADLDQDGDDEVLLYEHANAPRFHVLDGNGRLLRSWDVPFLLYDQPVVGDLDADGKPEIIALGYPFIAVWHADGTMVENWPVNFKDLPIFRGKEVGFFQVQLADVDGDGKPEIILGGVQALPPSPLTYGPVDPTDALVIALKLDGTVASGWPLYVPISPARPLFYSVAETPSIAVVDLEQDGRWELAASWGVAELNYFYGAIERPVTYAVWDMPAETALLPPWPMQSQNSQRTFAPPFSPILGQDGLLVFKVLARDDDADRLTYSVTGLPSGASFKSNTGLFRWRPTAAQAGTYPVTFAVSDGTATVTQSITIRVRTGNQKPQLTLPSTSYNINETQLLQFTLRATDADGDPVQFIGIDLPRGATLDRSTGQFVWRPDHAQAGNYSMTFSASDGALEERKVVRVNVANINRPPTLANPGSATIQEGQIIEFTLNAVDPDGDRLTFTVAGLPAGAALVPETGFFSWQPTFQQAGNYGPIRVTVSDGSLSATQSFSITVQDRAPWTTPQAPLIAGLEETPAYTNQAVLRLRGTKPAYTAVMINGVEVIPRNRLTTWETTVNLVEGPNALDIRVKDLAGLIGNSMRKIIDLDTRPPELTITTPAPNQVIPIT